MVRLSVIDLEKVGLGSVGLPPGRVLGPQHLSSARGIDPALFDAGNAFVDPVLGYAIVPQLPGVRSFLGGGRVAAASVTEDALFRVVRARKRRLRPGSRYMDYIDRLQGWPSALDGCGQVIGTLDSGVAADHPRLARDPSHADFCACDRARANTDDLQGHGTLCAGVIGARGTLGGLRTSICPSATVVAARIFREQPNYIRLSDLLLMISWCVHAAGARVLLLAYELARSRLEEQGNPTILGAIAQRMRRENIALLFVAAGRSGKELPFPAALPGVIPVADYWLSRATNRPMPSRLLKDLSNPGQNPDLLVGPYGPLLTTTLKHGEVSAGKHTRHRDFDGNSAATAFVAGMAALYMQCYQGLSVEQILELMKRNAEPIHVTDGSRRSWPGVRFP